MGLNVGLSLVTMTFAVGLCWDLRTRFWFWILVAILLVLHVPLILMISWPHGWTPGIALLPIGLVDLLFNVGVIRLVQKLVVRVAPPDQMA